MRNLVLLLGLSMCWGSPVAADPWQSLFNGSDLTGWMPVGGPGDNWLAVDGELKCTGKPGSQWLATRRQYDNFELTLEFNVPENGNSGVFVRAPKGGVPYVDGMEVQILDDFGDKWKSLAKDQLTGSVYAVIGPSRQVTKRAGQWQSLLVRCQGRKIQVTLNGQQIVDANLDEYSQQAEKVPGVKRHTGHIGLQNHGDPISFRRLKIRELKNTPESE